jgi:pilus assembly protein CpaD
MSSPIFKVARLRGADIARLAAIAGCAVMLAGCNTTREITGSTPADYRQRHPIVVKEGPRTVNLFIGEKRGTLTSSQRVEVIAFAGEWRQEATGGILIDVPEGTGNAAAAAVAAREVRSILTAAGVPPRSIALRPNRSSNPGTFATLRLHYPKIKADAGPCGLWPQDIGPSWGSGYTENREYWNLGCAQQRNLAAMVDNPSDLVQPRNEAPAYTAHRSTVLEKYRRGESTATQYPDADKGKISDIAK